MDLSTTPDFPWRTRRSGGRFVNFSGATSPTLKDVLRWKLGVLPPELPMHGDGVASERVGSGPERVSPDWQAIASVAPETLAVTWIGHSTFLIQIAGLCFLTDPHFGEYCAPVPLGSMRRRVPVGIQPEEIPAIDGVLLSHSHYDHLDRGSIQSLSKTPVTAAHGGPLFFCPSGVGAILQGWGIRRGVDFTWGESVVLGESAESVFVRGTAPLRITCLPAQHGSARTPFDRDETLWCGWLLECMGRKVVFLGDTGYAPFFAGMGERFGPVDLALIPIGAYRPRVLMRGVHLDPREAVRVHLELKSKCSVAMHWGTFSLADDPLDEAPELLQKAKLEAGVGGNSFVTLRIGETLLL